MNTFLSPIFHTLDTFSEAGNVFTEVLESLKLGLNTQQGSTFNVVEDIGNRLNMLMGGLSNTLINVGDVFGKISSMMTVILYLMTTAVQLGESLKGDLPGTAFRLFTGRGL